MQIVIVIDFFHFDFFEGRHHLKIQRERKKKQA